MIDTSPGPAQNRITFCSSVAEAAGEDPAGSAWALRRIIAVELPLPWPANVLESRSAPNGLTELLYEAYEALDEPWGMIGIAPDEAYSVEGYRRIIDLQQPEGIVAGSYRRVEYLVRPEEVVPTLRLLTFEPDHPRLAELRAPVGPDTRDFLICTHGTVDACCATFGYPMYKLMHAMADRAETPTRVWRCTHFGGHRFAATALEAPSGRYLGFLKADMLSGLVHRTASTRDLRAHYRGWAALPQRLWQIAEAELFASTSWDWEDAVITSITGDASEPEGGHLTIRFRHPATGNGEADIEIASSGSVQTMDTTNAEELRDSPQYAAQIIAHRPAWCLDRLGDGRR